MKSLAFKAKQIPNYISAFRILLVPVYVLFFFGVIDRGTQAEQLRAAGIVFILAGISDAVDGFLARRNNWITNVGKLLDPLADKLLEVAVTICLAVAFRGPFVILAVIIITKEIVMIVGAYLIMSKSNVYVSAVWCGKLATIVWYVLICVVHFFHTVAGGDLFLANLLCIILILVMLMAFVMYVFNYASQIESTKDAIIQNKKEQKKRESVEGK
ncbi:MAG: CDP-alcohol phosphatidyltransferase family protein [Clostridia bacterium]|nr:CDP-alcohol phosphatidyltransferase family protein [Clostridia bacterium]